MRLARKLTLAMATTALIVYSSGVVKSDEPQVPAAPVPDSWTIEVVPAATIRNLAPQAVGAPEEATESSVSVDRAEYLRIYNSIPFSRAEYRVNPGYRHDFAMEILTGNPRHQTIVKHNHEHKQPVRPNPAPARPSRILSPFTGWNNFLGIRSGILRGF